LLWDPLSEFLLPVGNAISRHHEREADAFVSQLMRETTTLTDALKRLARDNLANLYPHPLYAWVHYSHPPLLERVRYLSGLGQKTHTE
jgi:STE24 endopeptidase